ncbi:MAG: response regulator [Lachnospiraceae bacterium]|nr:response regulator [Lachnospiraceae bacterium]MDD3796308.1 response regulator [Lachnospiraceae bacterium]
MKMKILIVDDEHIVRRGMRAIIEKADAEWEVIGQEADGSSALQFMKKEVPDVLITDIRMTSMDGIQLSKEARAKWPELIILVVSGYSEFEFAKEAVRFGALDYLLKPTAPADLIRVLRKAENVLRTRNEGKVEALLRTRRTSQPASVKHSLVEDAIFYMTHHYEQELSTRDMADILHLNPNYFCELFKKETGVTFLEYLTNLRITMAKEILTQKVNVKTYEVAAMVGYSDSRYFSRLFKNATGMTPSEYKEKPPSFSVE